MALTIELLDGFYDLILGMPQYKTDICASGITYTFGDVKIQVEVNTHHVNEGYNVFRTDRWEVTVMRSEAFYNTSNWFTEIGGVIGDPDEIEADIIAARLWMD